MSGRRPLIKDYFGTTQVAGAVMSSAFREQARRKRQSDWRACACEW